MLDQAIPLSSPLIFPEYGERVKQQVLSGWLGPGAQVDRLTDVLAELTSTNATVATVSGSVALAVAARACGLLPGDEVLVPAYGVISVIHAFVFSGYRVRLVDIDPSSGCMSRAALEEALTSDTRAVCYVDFSGSLGFELVEIAALLRGKGIHLIEDAACALGQAVGDIRAGSLGTAATLSFSVPKVVTSGQGGAVVSRDGHLIEECRRLIDQGDLQWRSTGLNHSVGTNLRFNDVSAALLLAQLERLAELIARKREIHEILRLALNNCLYTCAGSAPPLHNIVFTSTPDDLCASLNSEGIAANRQYRIYSDHPPYHALAGQYPGAEHWAQHAVYLPFGMSLTRNDAARIADAVHRSRAKLLNPVVA